MRTIVFACLFLPIGFLPVRSMADFSGTTYSLNSPYSLYVTSADVSISNLVVGSSAVSTLVVSNAAGIPITVNWAAGGRAVGPGTTNFFSVPGGQIAEINVNAAVPGMVIYSTEIEQFPPPSNAPFPPAIPDLLYYKMTEGASAYEVNSGYFENSPDYLADSSAHGGTTGTITAVNVPIQWVPNENGTLATAVHFNGASTKLNTGNSTLFNFTTNLFTVNIWVRNLTYPCALCGNGLYRAYGWYIDVNPAGEIVAAAENPGSDSYVATTSTVAFVGQWCMVTVVRTGPSAVLIYRDGVLQNTIGAFANPTPSNDTLIFGDDYAGNQYDGDLGTIRIYSRPLSANEINALYLSDTTP